MSEESSEVFKSLNPWKSIWSYPRETMQYLMATGNVRHNELLFFLMGAANGLNRAMDNASGESWGLIGVLIAAPLIGGLGGLLAYNLFAWVIFQAGKAIGGRGSFKYVKSAFAWSMAPSILLLILFVPAIVVFGEELFFAYQPSIENDPILATALMAFGILMIFIGIWVIYIGINTLSVAHKFTRWMAFLNYVIAAILGFILIFMLSILFALF